MTLRITERGSQDLVNDILRPQNEPAPKATSTVFSQCSVKSGKMKARVGDGSLKSTAPSREVSRPGTSHSTVPSSLVRSGADLIQGPNVQRAVGMARVDKSASRSPDVLDLNDLPNDHLAMEAVIRASPGVEDRRRVGRNVVGSITQSSAAEDLSLPHTPAEPSDTRLNKAGHAHLDGSQTAREARAGMNSIGERGASSSPLRPGPARRRPKVETSAPLDFRPASRSSSESGSPMAKMTHRTLADLKAEGGGSRRRRGKKKNSAVESTTERDDGLNRSMSVTSSICSNRPSLTTCYVNFDKFDLQMENGRAPVELSSWNQLLALATNGTESEAEVSEWNVRQALDWCGWTTPSKFQSVAIPCVTQACRNVPDARSYTMLQAAQGLGKTSALVLGILASAQQGAIGLQYIVVALEACDDFERYMKTLGCLSALEVAYFKGETSPDIDEDVDKAAAAQVIVGHPARILEVLQAAQDQVPLFGVDVMFIDDASAIISGGLVQKVCEINQLLSLFVRRPLRYIAMSNFVGCEAKPALRALKSSLMNKKNMFDLSQQVGRIQKCVKHYLLVSSAQDWFRTLLQLRDMIYIPRAVIFCDNDTRFERMKKELLRSNVKDCGGGRMSVAVHDPGSQSQKERRDQLNAFCKEQHDFLLTRTEPNIFQSSLPRVFWIIHFGVEAPNLPSYGCRLLCLDTTLREKAAKNMHHDGVSICFLESNSQQVSPKLEKMFGISFEPLPFGDLA